MTPYGWDAPTLTRRYDVVRDVAELEDGREVVAVDAQPCLEPWGEWACGLVRNHAGNHWLCARELIECGPFAIVKPGPLLKALEEWPT